MKYISTLRESGVQYLSCSMVRVTHEIKTAIGKTRVRQTENALKGMLLPAPCYTFKYR